MPDRLFKRPQRIICIAAALAFLTSAFLSYERRNFNVNTPDWPHAPHLYVIDPGPSLRDDVTRELGRSEWAVVTYDGRSSTSFVQKISSLNPSNRAAGG